MTVEESGNRSKVQEVESVRVLFVDPETEFRRDVAAALRDRIDPCSVVSEQDADGGLDRLETDRIDCVVSEYDLPDADGLALLDAVQSFDPELPFLLCTGAGDEVVASRAIGAGVSDYVRKQTVRNRPEELAARVVDQVGDAVGRGDERDLPSTLAEERDRYETIIEAVGDPVYALDPDGRFTFANEALASLTGYPADELLGEHVSTILGEEAIAAGRESIKRLLERDARSETFEMDVVTSEGERLRCEDHLALLPRGPNGEFRGTAGVVRDITDRVDREETLALRNHAMDEASIGIVITDPTRPDNPIQYVNDGFERLTGYEETEVVGRNCRFLQGPVTDPETVAEMRAAIDEEEPVSVEVVNYRKDGTEFWNRVEITPVCDDTGTATHFIGFQRDVTERKRVETDLREREQQFRKLAEHLDDVVWMTDPDKDEMLYVNPVYEEVWGRSRESLYDDPMSFLDAIHPDDRGRVRDALDQQPTGGYHEEYRVVQPDGTVRWIQDRAVPVENETGEVSQVVGIAADITELKNRERMLTALNDAMRPLMRVRSTEKILEHAVATADEVLGLSCVSAFLYDAADNALEPVAQSPEVAEVIDGLPTFTPDDSIAWRTFVDEQPRAFDDVTTHEAVYNSDTPIRSELVLPLGDYGVLLAGDTKPSAFTDAELQFAELLAVNTRAALERAERERALQGRDRALEEQNEQLTKLSRINSIIRTIDRALVEATTREEIEREVCDRLVNADPYGGSVIASCELTRGETDVRTAAGLDEPTTEAFADCSSDNPVVTACRTREPVVVDRLREEPALNPWRNQTHQRGYYSAAVVPLVSGEALYGALVVYGDQPAAFDDREVTVLEELGQIIGRAIAAAETKRSLLADSTVEVELRSTDPGLFFVELTDELACTATLEGVVPIDDGALLAYVTIDGGSTEAVRELAADWATVDRCRPIDDGTDGRFEFTISGTFATLTLTEYGATIRSAEAVEGEGRVVAEVAPDADIQTIVDGVQSRFSETELVRKRTVDRPVETVDEWRSEMGDQLTARQRAVLRAAYFGGYFDWPRASTAEEVAESMDVSSSTLHYHLRHAHQRLLRSLFEGRDA